MLGGHIEDFQLRIDNECFWPLRHNRRQQKRVTFKIHHWNSMRSVTLYLPSTSPQMSNHYRVKHFHLSNTPPQIHSGKRGSHFHWDKSPIKVGPYVNWRRGSVASMSDPFCKRCWFYLKQKLLLELHLPYCIDRQASQELQGQIRSLRIRYDFVKRVT